MNGSILLLHRASLALLVGWLLGGVGGAAIADEEAAAEIDSTTLRQKVLCGYQGWFRCPGDSTKEGWRHWSRNSNRLGSDTLTFEMWPDLAEYDEDEKYPAPGFAYPDGSPAHLFSSANSKSVDRHFRWMKQYGIDGVFLQHFVVDLPGGPLENLYPSRRQVLKHVMEASEKTGRVWALSYDIAGMPADKIFDVLTTDWKKMVDEGITASPRYLRENGKPVVQVWGFYQNSPSIAMTPELAHRLVDFFHAEEQADARYRAYLVGGGDWDWRRDARWQEVVFRFDAYAPWNVGNYVKDDGGLPHASMAWWEADKRECERRGVLWLPVVYPGFSWDNLKRTSPGTSTIPRRGGEFFWEQFHELAKLDVQSVYVAMFDEVDEGTAIFKVTNQPPSPGRFVTYDGLPSDWYLRLTGEGGKLIRGQRPNSQAMPIRP